jgi:hypothetical protein
MRWEYTAWSFIKEKKTACEIIKDYEASAFHAKLTGMAHLLMCESQATNNKKKTWRLRNRGSYFLMLWGFGLVSCACAAPSAPMRSWSRFSYPAPLLRDSCYLLDHGN